MSVLEIARFRLREGVSVEDFLVHNDRVELEHVNVQPGYRPGSRRTTRTDDGTWVIAVGWESNAAADASMASFATAPATKGFMECVDERTMSMQRSTEVTSPSSRKAASARGLYLEGIRDGKIREAVSKYTGDRYTQHSTGVRDGAEGFLEFFDSFVKRNPKRAIEIVRAIEDGPYVFLHAYQSLNDGANEWVTTDLFDTDSRDRIVEHWDVISAFSGPNPSGRTQVDGTVVISDLERTEDNKARIQEFIQRVLVEGKVDLVAEYISSASYLQHNAQIGDGLEALAEVQMSYLEVFKVIGQGNFVVSYSRVEFNGEEMAVFDIFRLDGGMIVEHWDNMEPLPEKSELVNSGKF